jgi:very-short-patch-repair endonuclease
MTHKSTLKVAKLASTLFTIAQGVYVAVYIDGSHHDYAHQQARDRQQTDCLEDYGYHVIRFGYRDDWNAIIENNRHVFGGRS